MNKSTLLTAMFFSTAMLFAELPAPVVDLELNTGDVKTIQDVSANSAKVVVFAPGKLSWAEGPNGKALQFDGDCTAPRGALQIAPPQDFNLAKGFTLRFIFRTPDDYRRNVRYQLFQYGSGADKVTGLTLFLYWRGIHCRYGVKASGATQTAAGFVVKPATWYDCAVTYDTKAVTIYVDGKAVAATPDVRIDDLKARWFTIGATSPGGAGYAFKGLLGAARIYNRALTAEEISNLD